ncbi:AAA family ATPase [Aquabacterium sp. A7-Y]|uniref:ExeA family protein n=1 Tax=Aquabacterium sp. A7-Y TaxID=1349605 RepID=UPI00223D6F0B|nr:ExeA family protein [Aquabacterium sp. A7-Y]MCW7539129.1 AAA family ATPase [Aquabacterium sp. A7-Y]
MYAKHFGLQREPFSIAPDPRYLFMSDRHREALAHLRYGLRGGGGFVLLTGEIGAGKTTVCRCFLERIPKRCNVAYVFNPKLTVEELMQSVCDEFRIPREEGVPGPATVKECVDALNDFLLRTHAVGQNNVLIIDEAQNLSADVLEQLRLLTNLETNERKLLQIILIGQPELRSMLSQPGLEQLAQRVIARYHLDALSESETAQYIRHRLAVAGMSRPLPFERRAVQRIHELSRGVPRRINLLCNRALLGAYARGRSTVDREMVDKAGAEVFEGVENTLPRPLRWGRGAVLATGLAAGAALAGVVTLAIDVVPGKRDAVAATASAALPGPVQPVLQPVGPAVVPAAVAAPVAASGAASATAAPVVRSENEAWRELARAWQVQIPDNDDNPCETARRQQLQCFRSSSGLALIRQLGRPGILTLHDENERTVYALLIALGEDKATLRMRGVSQTLSLASLARMWRGEFATYWRAPPNYGGSDSPAGPSADWLGERLSRLPGGPRPGDGALDEAALKARVHAFQVAQGLKPDGVAGPVTLMQLNRATGVDEPRLQIER